VQTTCISCSEYSFPAVSTQRARIGIVRLLGFELVDVALFLADGSDLISDPGAIAASLRASLTEHELATEDVFLAVGGTVEDIAPNQRDGSVRARGRLEFSAGARVAAELGAPGITILPGVTGRRIRMQPGQPASRSSPGAWRRRPRWVWR